MRKKMCALVTAIIIVVMTTLSSFALDEYNLKEVDLKVSVPDGFATLTRNMDDNNPVIRKFDYNSADEINKEFKENYTYLNSSPRNGEYGITVVVKEDKYSKSLFNLNSYSEKNIKKGLKSAKKELAKQVDLKSTDFYKNDTATYVIFEGKVKDNQMYLVQYLTVYNGKVYNINLYSYDEEPSKETLETLKQTVDSIKFTKTLKKPFSILSPTGIDTIDKTIWGIIILFIVLIIYFISRNKKKNVTIKKYQ